MGALRVLQPAQINDESDHDYDAEYRRRSPKSEPLASSPVNMFGMIPASIFGLVDPGAVCVYGAIAQFARTDGRAAVSVDVLVRLIKKVSKPTVMKHIQALADAGLVVITERKRGSTRSFEYFLPMHPPVKKLDRSAINGDLDRSKEFTGTGQETSPVATGINDDRSKNFTGGETGVSKTLPVTGQEFSPVPVKNLYHQQKEDREVNDDVAREASPKQNDVPIDYVMERHFSQADVLDDRYRIAAIDLRFPLSRVQAEFDEFKDYWLSASGSSSYKLDWIAAWRNHLRSQFKRQNIQPVDGQALGDENKPVAPGQEKWRLAKVAL